MSELLGFGSIFCGSVFRYIGYRRRSRLKRSGEKSGCLTKFSSFSILQNSEVHRLLEKVEKHEKHEKPAKPEIFLLDSSGSGLVDCNRDRDHKNINCTKRAKSTAPKGQTGWRGNRLLPHLPMGWKTTFAWGGNRLLPPLPMG